MCDNVVQRREQTESDSLDRHALLLEAGLKHVGVHSDGLAGLAEVGTGMVLLSTSAEVEQSYKEWGLVCNKERTVSRESLGERQRTEDLFERLGGGLGSHVGRESSCQRRVRKAPSPNGSGSTCIVAARGSTRQAKSTSVCQRGKGSREAMG